MEPNAPSSVVFAETKNAAKMEKYHGTCQHQWIRKRNDSG